MVYLDPVAVVAEGVPWWVILLAVLAGLLVLALLVLLMWKVRLREVGPGVFPARQVAFHAVVLLPSHTLICSASLRSTLVCPRDSLRLWTSQREVRCRSWPQGFESQSSGGGEPCS